MCLAIERICATSPATWKLSSRRKEIRSAWFMPRSCKKMRKAIWYIIGIVDHKQA